MKIKNFQVAMTEDEYWQKHAKGEALPVMDQECRDCAVAFYGEFVEELKNQPREIQEAAVKCWFCHNDSRRSCLGVAKEFGLA